jgi:hypothetical protein
MYLYKYLTSNIKLLWEWLYRFKLFSYKESGLDLLYKSPDDTLVARNIFSLPIEKSNQMFLNEGGYPLGGFTKWDKMLYIKLNIFRNTSALSIHLKCEIYWVFFMYEILSQFVKPPSDTPIVISTCITYRHHHHLYNSYLPCYCITSPFSSNTILFQRFTIHYHIDTRLVYKTALKEIKRHIAEFQNPNSETSFPEEFQFFKLYGEENISSLEW